MNEKALERLIQEYEIRREKSENFLAIYPKLVKGGFIAIFTIPLIFMILMFSVESKLIFLMLWITSILIIAAYLIGIEYYYFYYQELHKEFDQLINQGKDKENSEHKEENLERIDGLEEDTKDEEKEDEDHMEGV